MEEKLKKYDQLHLMKYYNELSDEEKSYFCEQVKCLDFSVIGHKSASENRGTFLPIDAISISDIKAENEKYENVGINAIKSGKVGAVLLAGGQGSRLGFEHPKGMFNIGVERVLYIFECLINNLLDVVDKSGMMVPLFIMTSKQNDDETRVFFAEHNYFGYDSNYIRFFVQDELPTVDENGKLMLSSKGEISRGPNGNGGWYSSLINAGVLNDSIFENIEWLNVFAVDNVLQKMADPCFVGAVIESGKSSGAKVVSKAAPEERVGVMCLEDGKPSIVEYYEMTQEMLNQRNEDGTLSYTYGVILNYIFRKDCLESALGCEMPLHKAFKAISYLDENGVTVHPDKPNAYKYETLVLDMVKMQDSCLVYEVERSREFAPVKNKAGVDSIDTARELLKLNGVEL